MKKPKLNSEESDDTPELAIAQAIRLLVSPDQEAQRRRLSYLSVEFPGCSANLEENESMLNQLAGQPDEWATSIYPHFQPMTEVIHKYIMTTPSIRAKVIEMLTDMMKEIGAKRRPPINFGQPQTDEEITYLDSGEDSPPRKQGRFDKLKGNK